MGKQSRIKLRDDEMFDIDLHDAKIVGIKFNNNDDGLILNVRAINKVHYILEFKEVYRWVLTFFENQNVIFTIEKYISPPVWLLEEYNVENCIPDGLSAFYINSSVGMNGVIFSEDIILIEI